MRSPPGCPRCAMRSCSAWRSRHKPAAPSPGCCGRSPPRPNHRPRAYDLRWRRPMMTLPCISSSAAARRSPRRFIYRSKDRSMLWVALHFPGLATEALLTLAAWACQFTPRVSPEPPQALLLEVQGSLRYFGGRETLLASLKRALGELGLPAMLAEAPTARAALWRARAGGVPIEDVPLAVIGAEEAFFAAIGIGTVGELAALPREGLAVRCGQRLLDELDQALGRLPEPREFFVPPARFSAGLELPAEVHEAPALLFAARRLLAQLAGLLAARQAGVRAFTLNLVHRDRSQSTATIELASAARELERFAHLLRVKLGTLALSAPRGARGGVAHASGRKAWRLWRGGGGWRCSLWGFAISRRSARRAAASS